MLTLGCTPPDKRISRPSHELFSFDLLRHFGSQAKFFSQQEVLKNPLSCINSIVYTQQFPDVCYQIDRYVRKSCFGHIYKAIEYKVASGQIKRTRFVALKILWMDAKHIGTAAAEVCYRKLMDGHKNVLAIENFWTDAGGMFIVMPFAEYEDLWEVMRARRGPFTEDEARWLFHQIADGAYYLHKRGIALRDHSLENILLFDKTAENLVEPKIADPGQAVPLQYDAGGRVKEINERPFGKTWRPPEAYSDYPTYDPIKIDTFCLGYVLFILVINMKPFSTTKQLDVDWRLIRQGKFHMLLRRKKAAYLSAELQDLLWHMLDPDYKKRYTVGQCLEHQWFKHRYTCLNRERLLQIRTNDTSHCKPCVHCKASPRSEAEQPQARNPIKNGIVPRLGEAVRQDTVKISGTLASYMKKTFEESMPQLNRSPAKSIKASITGKSLQHFGIKPSALGDTKIVTLRSPEIKKHLLLTRQNVVQSITHQTDTKLGASRAGSFTSSTASEKHSDLNQVQSQQTSAHLDNFSCTPGSQRSSNGPQFTGSVSPLLVDACLQQSRPTSQVDLSPMGTKNSLSGRSTLTSGRQCNKAASSVGCENNSLGTSGIGTPQKTANLEKKGTILSACDETQHPTGPSTGVLITTALRLADKVAPHQALQISSKCLSSNDSPGRFLQDSPSAGSPGVTVAREEIVEVLDLSSLSSISRFKPPKPAAVSSSGQSGAGRPNTKMEAKSTPDPASRARSKSPQPLLHNPQISISESSPISDTEPTLSGQRKLSGPKPCDKNVGNAAQKSLFVKTLGSFGTSKDKSDPSFVRSQVEEIEKLFAKQFMDKLRGEFHEQRKFLPGTNQKSEQHTEDKCLTPASSPVSGISITTSTGDSSCKGQLPGSPTAKAGDRQTAPLAPVTSQPTLPDAATKTEMTALKLQSRFESMRNSNGALLPHFDIKSEKDIQRWKESLKTQFSQKQARDQSCTYTKLLREEHHMSSFHCVRRSVHDLDDSSKNQVLSSGPDETLTNGLNFGKDRSDPKRFAANVGKPFLSPSSHEHPCSLGFNSLMSSEDPYYELTDDYADDGSDISKESLLD